jgi:hypothetical protein
MKVNIRHLYCGEVLSIDPRNLEYAGYDGTNCDNTIHLTGCCNKYNPGFYSCIDNDEVAENGWTWEQLISHEHLHNLLEKLISDETSAGLDSMNYELSYFIDDWIFPESRYIADAYDMNGILDNGAIEEFLTCQ